MKNNDLELLYELQNLVCSVNTICGLLVKNGVCTLDELINSINERREQDTVLQSLKSAIDLDSIIKDTEISDEECEAKVKSILEKQGMSEMEIMNQLKDLKAARILTALTGMKLFE